MDFKEIKKIKNIDSTVIFYTCNFIGEEFASKIRKQLVKSIKGLPLITVSQKPMGKEMFEGHEGEYKNICLGYIGRNHFNIYFQSLIGVRETKTKYISLVEDDVLYSQKHFEHIPKQGKFAYDRSIWGIYTWTKPPVFSWKGRRNLWTLVCERELFIEAMEERFAKYPIEMLREELDKGSKKISHLKKIWSEPGKYEGQLGVKVRDWEFYYADQPSVQFSHPTSLSYLNLGERKKLGEIQRESLDPWGNCENILSIYNNKSMKSPADLAEEEFNRIHRDKQKPSNIEEQEFKIIEWKLPELLIELGLVSSKSEVHRLVQQNGIKIDDIVQDDWDKDIEIKNGMIVQVGKRNFKKIIYQTNNKNMNEEKKEGILSNIVKGMSPTPRKVKEMDFPDALREVIAGKKITKLEWCNKEVVVFLENEVLVIYRDDGKPYQLIISEGDIKGEDWIVVDK